MIQSMTGFANKTFIITSPRGERSTISISIKSLNARFFEATVKLPAGLSHLEPTCIKQFKNRLCRGHIYCTLYVSNHNIFEGPATPVFSTIDAYVAFMQEIKERYNLQDTITLSTLLSLPAIFSKEEQTIDEKSVNEIISAVSNLIDKVIEERCIEGATISTDILNRIAVIKNEMQSITTRASIVIAEKKHKVHEALQDIGADENLLANAQKNGLYALLDKVDIHEEITRLNSHLGHLIHHLESDNTEKGKRLDFTLQELGREINTIAAKCSDSLISSCAINIKVEIEKIREQIQNIV